MIAKITSSCERRERTDAAGAAVKESEVAGFNRNRGAPDLQSCRWPSSRSAAFPLAAKPMGPQSSRTCRRASDAIGISNGVYLTAKAASKTGFEKIADKDEESKKTQAESTKAEEEARKRER